MTPQERQHANYLRNREKVLARHREYYRANRERVIARVVKYHRDNPHIVEKCLNNFKERHPDRIKEQNQRSKLKHRDSIRARRQEYYRKHRDRLAAKAKAFRRTETGFWKQYQADWRAKNQTHLKAYRQKYRARQNLRKREYYSNNLWHVRSQKCHATHLRRALVKTTSAEERKDAKLFIRQIRARKYVNCFWCGDFLAGLKCDIDHIIALSLGGKHVRENLCASCPSCNRSKGAKKLSDWLHYKAL